MEYIEPKDRPPYRWMMSGPLGTGTDVHRDPQGTGAWNALFAGAKLWAVMDMELTLDELGAGGIKVSLYMASLCMAYTSMQAHLCMASLYKCLYVQTSLYTCVPIYRCPYVASLYTGVPMYGAPIYAVPMYRRPYTQVSL